MSQTITKVIRGFETEHYSEIESDQSKSPPANQNKRHH